MPSIDSNNLKLLYLSLYIINNQSEIETNWDRRENEINLYMQSQSRRSAVLLFISTIEVFRDFNSVLQFFTLNSLNIISEQAATVVALKRKMNYRYEIVNLYDDEGRN